MEFAGERCQNPKITTCANLNFWFSWSLRAVGIDPSRQVSMTVSHAASRSPFSDRDRQKRTKNIGNRRKSGWLEAPGPKNVTTEQKKSKTEVLLRQDSIFDDSNSLIRSAAISAVATERWCPALHAMTTNDWVRIRPSTCSRTVSYTHLTLPTNREV